MDTIKNFIQKKEGFGVLFFLIGLFLMAGPAIAHKIIVFAWAQGDIVYVQSKFSRGKKVRGGEVIVSDAAGNRLLTGKTDDKGEFSFKAPKKTDLKIEVIAGMGHRAEWILSAEDIDVPEDDKRRISESSAPDSPERESRPETPEAESRSYETREPESGHNRELRITQEELYKIVEAAVDKKLKPLMKMMAELQDPGPSLTDILGGIGYILGLMGVAAYFNARRKSS